MQPDDHDDDRVYRLAQPTRGRSAVLVEVPHAGLDVPDDVRPQIVADAHAIARDADLFVDRLYVGAPDAGAGLLVAKLSRYVVDLNRAEDDVDLDAVIDHPDPRRAQPRGVVWRLTTDGRPALKRPLRFAELRQRLDRFYRPYHAALVRELERRRREHGHAILVAGHSMPSVGRALHSDAGVRRADIVPGTRSRTSAAGRVIDLVEAHFRAAGLTVRHDDPYMGGWTTQQYGRPDAGIHVVQIEVNRALYMDESTLTYRDADASRLGALLDDLIAKL
ncbi:MAG: N-formylglutamate amidohydrolase, partial [Deltaproteobacteria bacterium]|nr:N-formylglutamate amidohydrolase [Deltaproteobacteria bacterium]